MKDRIKAIRKAFDLTQAEFGARLGIKGNTVAMYELGRSNPIDAVVSLICREFGVDEQWLRTGEGEMLRPMSKAEDIAFEMGKLLKDDPELESFRARVIAAALKVGPDGWAALEAFFNELSGEK